MKLRSAPLLAAALAFIAFAHGDLLAAKEAFSRSHAFNPDGVVSLHNVNGNITVETWDKNEILIEGEKSAKTDEELNLIELTIDLTADKADIRVRLPKRNGKSVRGGVSFAIKVPATASLDPIKTVNSSITVTGLRGSVALETVNGQIRATDLGANAHLGTVNGQINASFSQVAAGQELRAKTVNGSVHLTLPADAGFTVAGSVVNGHIDCDFPLETKGKIGRKRVNGTVGDGRASITASSVNGSIHLKSR